MYTIKHRTYYQLMADVKQDFKRLNADGMIDDQDYIMEVAAVNKELGLKIHTTKNKLIEIRNGRGKLPADFHVYNYSLMLQMFTEVVPAHDYGQTVVVPVPPVNYEENSTINVCIPPVNEPVPTPAPCDPCNTCSPETHCGDCEHPYNQCYCVSTNNIRVDCHGNQTVVLQKFRTHTRVYGKYRKMNLINSPTFVDEYCLTFNDLSCGKVWIKDGFIYSSVPNGNLYLNYEGMLEDEEGNLLVMDHDIINKFYMYAVKKKILENAVMDNYPVTQMQLTMINNEYRIWRTKAIAINKMPDFAVMRDTQKAMRKAMFKKYVSNFKP